MGRKLMKLKIEVPENFTNETRRFMRSVLKELNEREDVQPLLLEGVVMLLMNCYETAMKASRELRLSDEVIQIDKKDNQVANPAVGIQLKANQQVLALMKELGLTLKARKVLDAVSDDGSELDKFEKEFD